MMNKKTKLIYFLATIAFVFSAYVFLSPAPSFADHCTYPETHHSDGTCYCEDSIDDCSDPCGDGRLASCDTCTNGADNPPDCNSCPTGQEMYGGNCVDVCPDYQHRDLFTGQCVADSCPPGQEGVPPFCYDPVCVPPEEGTYPDCGTCTVSGTSGYPTCKCTNTGNAPTGNPPACIVTTYCCNDDNALNDDPNCPDANNNKVEDNSGTCEYCTSSSTDPKCKVSYCPDTDPGGASCKAANPDMNCTSDEGSCKYYYCDKSTGRPNNYDPNGADCKASHPAPRQCLADDFVCQYDDVPYCDEGANPDATNGQTQSECEDWNDPHPCVSDDDVCSYPCSGGNCVEIFYCSLPGFSNSDFGGVSCNSTKPADAVCVAAPMTCTGCTTCTPQEYCNDPAFINYDAGGASCKASFPVCTGARSACSGLASCDIDFDVDVTCESGFTYTGTFAYSYTYNNTEQCVAPTGTELTNITNYLEGIICDDVIVIDGFDDVDWCPLMDGIQTDPLDCLDVCPDMEGLQHNQTDCPDYDLCTNIEGFQDILPPGSTRNASGECDVCSNIEGFQVTVPTGSTRDAFSNTCDLCTNQEGFQTTLRNCELRNIDGTCERELECWCEPPDPNCYDYKIDGLCGSAQGKTYQPGETVGGQITVLGVPTTYSTCYAGTYASLTLSGTNYTWKCNGIGIGSSNASCSALLGCRTSGETICPYTGACLTTEECEDICVTNPALCDPCLIDPAKCVHDCKTDESKCLGAVELDRLATTPPLGSAGFECSVDLNGAFLKYDKKTHCKLTGNAFANYDPTQSCNITSTNGVLFTFKPIDLPLSYFFIVDDVCTDSIYTLTCWQSGKPDETVSVEGSCRVNYRYKEIR